MLWPYHLISSDLFLFPTVMLGKKKKNPKNKKKKNKKERESKSLNIILPLPYEQVYIQSFILNIFP